MPCYVITCIVQRQHKRARVKATLPKVSCSVMNILRLQTLVRSTGVRSQSFQTQFFSFIFFSVPENKIVLCGIMPPQGV